jgi:hypothetical protein
MSSVPILADVRHNSQLCRAANYAKPLCTDKLQAMYVQTLVFRLLCDRGFRAVHSTDVSEDPQLPPKLSRVELRIATSDLRVWREAAVREKQKLSEWIRRACDERVEREAIAREARARELKRAREK